MDVKCVFSVCVYIATTRVLTHVANTLTIFKAPYGFDVKLPVISVV